MVSTTFSPAITQRPQNVRFTAQQNQLTSQQPPVSFPPPMTLPEDTILKNLNSALSSIDNKSNTVGARLKMYG